MNAAKDLSSGTGIKTACEAFQLSRATYYRHQASDEPLTVESQSQRMFSPLALTHDERQNVLDTLHSEEFQDKAPYQIYATLLDKGGYQCSIRTMYRILEAEHGDIKERRRQVQRSNYVKPELLATGPNQVWSWDITKLKSVTKWTYFYLYVIIDIFSRYVVGGWSPLKRRPHWPKD